MRLWGCFTLNFLYSMGFTGKITTKYYFDIHEAHFREALDRLSRFFIDPLLLPDSLDRELVNVDSEYSKDCNSDVRRILNLQRAKGPYPYCKFSTGNITTLREKPKVRDALDTYFSSHFQKLITVKLSGWTNQCETSFWTAHFETAI